MSQQQYTQNQAVNVNTVCFAMPRSGSTLLMRMVGMACHTPVRGDFQLKFYEDFLSLRKSAKELPIYGDLNKMESDSVFADCIRGRSETQHQRMLDYHLKNILMGSTGTSFTKITIMGFGNELLSSFIDALRSMYDYNCGANLNIVFLTRSVEDCVKSLKAKSPNINTEIVRRAYINQIEQFKDACEIGDNWIKYNDILEDPINTLVKLQPRYYPIEHIAKRILKNKIK